MKLMDPEQVRALEPYTQCIQGLHVPTTGIVDFQQVARAYARVFEAEGGQLLTNHRVTGIRSKSGHIELETSQNSLTTRLLINCGGLYADHLARMAGMTPPCRIVPFRGEYYRIKPQRSFMVKGLIYPVPDPRFPFLGVHFTRMIDGKVEAGPNAVLAWAREGYEKSTICLPELLETLRYRGFWRLALRYWQPAFHEVARSYSKSRFTRALQQLIPDIRSEDLLPGGAGVRAQALGKDGALLDDFVIMKGERMVHVLNAPSPAATSALAIARHIASAASGS
jgi:L-2-hydroxyglutarate oxidase LhgO